MRTINSWLAAWVATGAMVAGAVTNDITGALQRGLFEEEANHNLPAAIQAYQAVINQFDKDRKLAATAVFRLGECYRKQGNTNEANAQYERVLREFADQAPLVALSRQNLGAAKGSVANAPTDSMAGPDLAEAEKTIASLRTRLDRLSNLKPEEMRIAVQQDFPNPVLNSLMQKLVDAEQQLVVAQRDYASQHPEVVKQAAVVSTIKQQIDAQIQGVLGGLRAKLSELEGQLSEAKSARPIQPAKDSLAETTPGGVPATSTEAEEVKRIQAIIKNSPDLINAKDVTTSQTPLQQAAVRGQLVVARFLLDNGAEINATGGSGYTALHYAANAGHKAMAELLLDRGANIEAKDNSGDTALHLAASRGFKTVAEVLLNRKANVNAREDAGWTPLHKAASAGRLAVVELLLARKADVNAKNAVPSNGCSPSWRTGGATPLVEAILAKRIDVLKQLLANKAEVNFECEAWLDYGGDTRGFPLHLAIGVDNPEMVELLLKNGANPNALPQGQRPAKTPLVLAFARDPRVNLQEIAPLLLAHKADPNTAGADNRTPLHEAVGHWRSREFTELLLKNGAEVNCQDSEGHAPLHYAASSGAKEIAALLLEYGANPDAKDNSGNTPLHDAVRSGQKEIIELLLAKGANVNLTNNDGATPLAMTQPRPPSAIGVPGLPFPAPAAPAAMFAPRTMRMPGSSPNQPASPEEMAEVLRQHGAVAELPDFNSIRATRQGRGPETVFVRGTNMINGFTLLEVLRNVLRPAGPVPSGYSFPDLAQIKIWRPLAGSTAEKKEMRVSVISGQGNFDCAADVPLQFGDVIEIPERVHTLAERSTELTSNQSTELSDCVRRKVTFSVQEKLTEVVLGGYRNGTYLASALKSPEVQAILRSSSDFTKVRVRRTNPETKQVTEFIQDVVPFWDQKIPFYSDLWLRDGDVVEVPDKL